MTDDNSIKNAPDAYKLDDVWRTSPQLAEKVQEFYKLAEEYERLLWELRTMAAEIEPNWRDATN